jgi:hypothetical protein
MARRPRRSAERPTPRSARRTAAGTPATANAGLPVLARRLERQGPQARGARQQRVRDAVAAAAVEIRQRVDAGHELWQSATGEPMPLELDEIRAAAARFGLSSDAVLAGDFSLGDVTTLMVGKRLAAADEYRDRVRAATAEAAVHRAAGASTTSVPTTGSTQAKAFAGPRRTRHSGDSATTTKIIAALTEHHRYADGSCLVDEPIENNELARKARVAKATASTFFRKKFYSHYGYKSICGNKSKLVASLKMLNGEFAPRVLLRSDPSDTNHDE